MICAPWPSGSPRGLGGKFVVERHPELLGLRELKAFRHHADDGGGAAVYPDRLPDDFRVAVEIALPDFVAEDGGFLGARLVIRGGEIAPENRRDVDDLEEIIGHITAGVALRFSLVGDVDGRAVEVGRHHRERPLRRAHILVVLGRRNVAGAVVILLVGRLRIDQADRRELLRMREGKAAQDERIHDRELRRNAANPEREHGDREEAEDLFFAQHAQTDPHILEERFEEHNR